MTLKLRQRRLVQDAQQGSEPTVGQPARLRDGVGCARGVLLGFVAWVIIGVISWACWKLWEF